MSLMGWLGLGLGVFLILVAVGLTAYSNYKHHGRWTR